jgi:hypothetical protein
MTSLLARVRQAIARSWTAILKLFGHGRPLVVAAPAVPVSQFPRRIHVPGDEPTIRCRAVDPESQLSGLFSSANDFVTAAQTRLYEAIRDQASVETIARLSRDVRRALAARDEAFERWTHADADCEVGNGAD